MKARINSIKQHTLLLLVSLTLGLALVFSSLAVITAFVVEDILLENFLDQQANNIQNYYAKYGQLPAQQFEFVDLFENTTDLPDWASKSIRPEKLSGEIFTADATHYHYRKLQLGNRQAYLLAEVSRLLVVTNQSQIFSLFALVFLVAIILSIWLAFRFSRKIVKPVLTLADAVAANINSDNKTRLPNLPYELGYLSDTLQTSFDRFNQLLEREKAFANNVSHELRTPLTVLKNAIQLIEQRGFKPDDLDAVKNSCDHIEQTVNVLLALARTESHEMQDCYLKESLEQAILRCHKLLEHFNIQLVVSENKLVKANPLLMELLFINLLRNATEHSSTPELMIIGENGNLIFENNYHINFHVDFTLAGTKSSASKGIGQGLYLVARIAEYFGWQLNVEIADQKFRVLINFQ